MNNWLLIVSAFFLILPLNTVWSQGAKPNRWIEYKGSSGQPPRKAGAPRISSSSEISTITVSPDLIAMGCPGSGSGRISYLSVPGAAFLPTLPIVTLGGVSDSGPNWSFANSGTLSNKSNSAFQNYVSPAYLPHCARVLEILAEFSAFRDIPTPSWPSSVRFRRIQTYTMGAVPDQCITELDEDLDSDPRCGTDTAGASSQTESDIIRYFHLVSDISPSQIIDNAHYAYVLNLTLGDMNTLHMIRIKYEEPSAP